MGRGTLPSSDRGVCWWGELLAALPSAAYGGCPSKAGLTGASSVAVLRALCYHETLCRCGLTRNNYFD